MYVFVKTSQIIANSSEPLTYLKDLEVSDGSDSESDTDMKHQDSTKTYIQPLVDPNGDISDLDSADEEEWSIDNVSVNRLLASAVLETKRIGKVGIISV